MKQGNFTGRVFDWRAEEDVLSWELEESANGAAYDVVCFTNDSYYYTG